MRKKCLFGLILVIAITVLSVVAFAYSFGDTKITDKRIRMAPKSGTDISEIRDRTTIASMDWDAKEAYLLAKIAMAEAEGEDIEGKALVILVVLNRVWDEQFPNSISEVIYQRGQFSPVSNGRFETVEPDADCYRALELIQSGKWDLSYGATYFESKSDSVWHRENLRFMFKHGNHYFYKDKEK